MSSTQQPVIVPVGTIRQRLDNDDPNYIFAPDLYMGLALAYDSLAAPGVSTGRDGVMEPRYDMMQPRLALAWEAQANGDWIVRLRPGVRSHAGNELTADNIAWVFDKVTAQQVMACWRWREVVGVTRIEVLDRHSLRFHLRSPYPHFPNWLISVSFNIVDSTAIRAHVTAGDPWGIDWLNAHVAGFGAYDLAEMGPERLLFTHRRDYWTGPPEASAVEVRKVASRAEAIRMLDEARPVVLAGLFPDEAVALLKRDDLTVLRTWAGHDSVEIDFTAAPFDDARVRHALAFATPTNRLITEGLLGQGRPWRSPVKGFSQWYSGASWHYDHDIARARRLLAEARLGSGLKSDFYVDQRRPYNVRMAEIIAAAWQEVGIELVMRDLNGTPEGWLPPLFLRTECAHNLSEPIYDLAHDYAAMNPIFPLPGGPAHVGNWRPRWKKNPGAIEQFGAMLCEPDAGRTRERFDALQSWLVEFGSSVFIAEGQQVMVANRHVPASLIAPESRFFQALNHQNCTTNYLPRD
jgi:peptide/nickel transport system substrate-binding protein